MKPAAVLVALAFACTVAPAAAQAYKWKDASGKVHFSDEPPPDRKADRISIRPQMPENPEAAARNRDWRTQLEESGVRRQEQQNREAAERHNRQAAESRCRAARSSLDTLQRQGRVWYPGADGQREFLEDKDRPAALQRAQERVARECR